MKKAIIFGTNEFSGVIHYHIQRDPDSPQVMAFVVDREYRTQDEFCGLEVAAAEDMVSRFPASEYGVYNCIGYKNMNEGRRSVFNRLKEDGYTILSFIHPSAHIHAAKIGEGTIALHNVVIDVESTIGNCNIFMTNTVLGHHVNIGSFNWFSYHSVISGRATLGNCCFVGLNASVAHNLTLADKTLVGVGACATRNVPEEGTLLAAPRMIILNGKARLARF